MFSDRPRQRRIPVTQADICTWSEAMVATWSTQAEAVVDVAC